MRRGLAILAVCAFCGAVPAGAQAAFPGTNGNIAFGRFIGEGGGSIFSMNLATPGQAQLTSGRICRHPSYSGDGERIAFSCITGPATSSSEIFTMAANGQEEVPVTSNNFEDLDPSFSPDGRTIAFSRFAGGNGDIIGIAADGLNEAPLVAGPTSDSGPAFSPDGTKIAFVRNDGDSEIFVMNADGTNPVQLTDNAVFDGAPSYSPDGRRIVFSRRNGTDNDLFVMDADGSNQMILVDTPTSETTPTYSPDGQRLVYSVFDSATMATRLHLADADGQNATELTTTVPPEADLQPSWQPLNDPVCELSGPPRQRSAKQVEVTVACSEDVLAFASGELFAPQPRAHVTASKKKKRKFIPLRDVVANVEANAATTLTLDPDPKRRGKFLKKTLKAGLKAKGTIELSASDDLGAFTGDVFDVTVKKKKKK